MSKLHTAIGHAATTLGVIRHAGKAAARGTANTGIRVTHGARLKTANGLKALAKMIAPATKQPKLLVARKVVVKQTKTVKRLAAPRKKPAAHKPEVHTPAPDLTSGANLAGAAA